MKTDLCGTNEKCFRVSYLLLISFVKFVCVSFTTKITRNFCQLSITFWKGGARSRKETVTFGSGSDSQAGNHNHFLGMEMIFAEVDII